MKYGVISLTLALILSLFAISATLVAADPIYDPNPDEDGVFYPYWNRGLPATATYFWNNWGMVEGQNTYGADNVIGNVTGSAVVNVADGGAGLIEGGEWTEAAFGSATNFWDMGPGGTISLTLNDLNAGSNGMDIWIQVKYHVGMAEVPMINVRTVDGNGVYEPDPKPRDTGWFYLDFVESTGNYGGTETGWMVYQALWRIDPGHTLAGIDISTGNNGSIIDSIVVDTQILPEATPILLAVLGIGTILALRKMRTLRLVAH